MRGVKGSGKGKKPAPKEKKSKRGAKVELVVKGVNKETPATERLTVSIGARATIRVGDHEFISPDIMYNNIDPNGDIDAQLKDAARVVDKAWQAILVQISEKVNVFKENATE